MTQRQNKTQIINQRMIVLEMLLTETVYSHMIVYDVLNKYNYLSQQEKSFIKRLYEGTLERQIELDYVLDQYSKVKTNKMKKVIRAIMRISVYQILYMDAVPDAAACNEAVKLAQKKGFSSLKGFVNGVLRSIVRNKNNLSYDRCCSIVPLCVVSVFRTAFTAISFVIFVWFGISRKRIVTKCSSKSPGICAFCIQSVWNR